MLVRPLKFIALALLVFSFWLAAGLTYAQEGVAGLYVVQGMRTDGKPYGGVAKISAVSSTYEIIWQIGKDTFHGRGVAYGKSLAFAFVGAGFTKANIVLYERAGAGIWCGVWTSDNPSQIGKETLILRSDVATPPNFDCSGTTASRDGVDVLDRQVAWDDGDGHPQLADELGRQGGN
jgi:hypothetical protein